MKPLVLPVIAAAGVTAAVISTPPPELGSKWVKHHLSRFFWAEGACVADINSDGHMDVLSGPYWYAGPDFKAKHGIYVADESFESQGEKIEGFFGEISGKNGYSNNFLSYSEDFNSDGRPDYLVVGWPGKETFWYENPGKFDQPWSRHTAIRVTDNESPLFVDIDGDKIKDLLCMSGGRIGYASYDPKQPEAEWRWFPVTPQDKKKYQRYTHGIGYGDINGDGLVDILEAKGWWERPADWDGKKIWKFHAVDFGKGGAQMFGYDVNADGRTDVITSIEAHGFGVAWFEQDEAGGVETPLDHRDCQRERDYRNCIFPASCAGFRGSGRQQNTGHCDRQALLGSWAQEGP